jgi:plastocyanin
MRAASISAATTLSGRAKTPRQLLITFGALVVVAVVGWGCSPNSKDSVVPTQATEPVSGPLELQARDISFVPDEAEAFVGETTIEVTNVGAENHSFTLYEDESYATVVEGGVIPVIGPGETASTTFEMTEPAELRFRCEVHPEWMTGTLSVGTRADP